MNKVNISGEITQTLILPVSEEAKEALEKTGITAPDEVTLELREATLRERERLDQRQRGGDFDGPAALENMAALLAQRADCSAPVLAEVLKDATQPMLASLFTAYITGELPDPKAAAALLRKTQSGLLTQMMQQLAASEPFSVESTDSGLGKSGGSASDNLANSATI